MVVKGWTSVLLLLWNLELSCSKIHNFISMDALTDGEVERLVHYNGLTAKETSVVARGEAEG